MSLRKHRPEEVNYNPSDLLGEKESVELLKHRRKLRKTIEDRLDRKRLHDEIDELDGNFDWDEVDR